MAILAKNQRAYFDYTVEETFTAGLVLEGREVKSAKSGNVSMQGAFVSVNADGARILGMHIGPYKFAPNDNYNPTRTRELLLNKSEIKKFLGKEKGLTIIPLELYSTAKGLVKLKIGLAKAKKKVDKREHIKKREIEREMRNIS
ncbi:MAG TPA: SsrA-binding protein SmpB [Patescibacteria group bacterium]|nr:SsrA-binding protein SmpB [Patescibacteria group bacterium]